MVEHMSIERLEFMLELAKKLTEEQGENVITYITGMISGISYNAMKNGK